MRGSGSQLSGMLEAWMFCQMKPEMELAALDFIAQIAKIVGRSWRVTSACCLKGRKVYATYRSVSLLECYENTNIDNCHY